MGTTTIVRSPTLHESLIAPTAPVRRIALIDDIISDGPAIYVTQITMPVTPSK